MRNVSILVTVGPATDNEEMIKKIVDSGVDFIRLNMSHSSVEDLERMVVIAKKFNIPFVLDTEGPQIRSGGLKRNVIVLEEGKEVKIHDKEIDGDEENICLRPSSVVSQLQIGDLIALDFDTLLLKVSDVSPLKDKGYVLSKVVTGGVLGRNKSAIIDQTFDSIVRLPILSPKDLESIKIGLKYNIGYIAASFTRNGEDVDEVRKLTGSKMQIISKVETREAMNNLDPIIEKSDYLLIDRGDLSKEISLDKIPFAQKIILNKARELKKPVFIATNLLESMIEKPKPTRAELNDIMNSLLDGASGLVLCAETAIGRYPLECINMLKKMIKHSSVVSDVEFEETSINHVVKRLEELDYIGSSLMGGSLIEPHGGKLVNRILKRPIDKDYLNNLPSIRIDENKQMDVEQIAIGTFSPLEGFMGEADFKSVLNNMRLSNGLVWTIPIILDVNKEDVKEINPGQSVVLLDDDGPMAILHVEEKFSYDKVDAIKKWFGTENKSHPGIVMVQNMGDTLLSGKIDLIRGKKSDFKEYELTPAQVRKIFEERGWNKIVGFHTRNVIHRGHEYIQLDALKKNSCDGLFVHPVIGKKKKGDFNTKFIIKAYEMMMDNFYPKNKVVFSVFSTYSRYAGPREAIFTAICRQNFGCSHFIVGRDHTGVGNFYHPGASHQIFDKFPELLIKPLVYDKIFYSEIYKRYVSEKDAPEHPADKKFSLSGTEARKIFEAGKNPPDWFMRPEIAKIITDAIRNREEIFVK